MSDPGTADLSADVDFSFLKQTIRERSGKLYANATTRLLNKKKRYYCLRTNYAIKLLTSTWYTY